MRSRRASLLFRLRHSRGTILILVMWIALGLVVVALYFGHTVGLMYRGADNGFAGLQAEQAVEGAARYVAYSLETYVEPGEIPSIDELDYEAEMVPLGDATFWLVGRDHASDVYPSEPVYGLVDEAAKLNLNTATLEMLEALPNMTSELAAAIVDWRDEDSEINSGGAEAQDYLLLDDPYIAKDSGFESVEELRLLIGADLELLYGEDTNRNGVLDPNEDDGDESPPADDGDGALDPGIVEYVTVFSREPNVREDGSSRINLSDQSASQSLEQLLTDAFGAGRAEELLSPVQNNLAGVGSPLGFYIQSGITPSEFAEIEDALTSQSGDYAVGLVNLSTAPLQVLACLPGMNEEMARDLVSHRNGLDQESLDSVVWVASVLDPEIVQLIGPYVTARSFQFSADIVAVGKNGRGFRRVWMVLDYEEDATVIYRRDLTRSGWPLGKGVRETLRSQS